MHVDFERLGIEFEAGQQQSDEIRSVEVTGDVDEALQFEPEKEGEAEK